MLPALPVEPGSVDDLITSDAGPTPDKVILLATFMAMSPPRPIPLVVLLISAPSMIAKVPEVM
jgi:hypothetical protein